MIRDLPIPERPRERLARCGPEAVSACELLAIVIGSGIEGESAVHLAQRALRAFGSLRELSLASLEMLSRLKGIGPARATQIKASLELGKRIGQEEDVRIIVSGAADVARIVCPRLNGCAKESFLLLCLDARNVVRKICSLSTGTVESSVVHPRDVFKEAVQALASSIILVHNHPSGFPDPSQEDAALTRRMILAGELIGIPVLDHVIVVQHGYYSFQEHGLMRQAIA